MDEKVLIKSEPYNVKKLFAIIVIIGLILSIAALTVMTISAYDEYSNDRKIYEEHCEQGYCLQNLDGECYTCRWYPKGEDAFWNGYLSWYFDSIFALIWILPFPVFALIGFIIFLSLRGFDLTVTDKRILGSIRKKRVDLPIDSVSAVSIGAFKSISVATSSGKISFSAIKNRNEIHEVVSKLLVERQNQAPKSAATVVNAPAASNADELKKFKELLDAGIITQEEFDAKKKQLLGL